MARKCGSARNVTRYWIHRSKIMARLKEYYLKEVVPSLIKEFNYQNRMEVPRLEKIVVNMGLGEAIQNIKILDSAVIELSTIVGQRPVITKAKKSIATFKLRQGMSIGCQVTLRREKMYEFFDRLVNVALPRVRDFRGISPKSFDGRGNFSAGLKEQIIFPEIDYDKIDKVKGMNISIVTSAKTDDEARQLLKLMGLPFRS
jgi:large subunit ribosomal protein L5